MRITVEDAIDEVILKVEGRLIQPWTSELESVWTELDLESKRLSLDISGMLFADTTGVQLLSRIASQPHCRIRADSPLTRDFADQITQNNSI